MKKTKFGEMVYDYMIHTKQEKGITLIALIITIIILVILAAVSIRAVTNMGIVGKAINGAQDYAKTSKDENKILDETGSYIDDALKRVNGVTNGSGITLNKSETTLQSGDENLASEKLTVSFKNVKGDVTWTSSAIAVATVANDGTVTAVDEGTAIITAKVIFNGKEYTASCEVTVEKPVIAFAAAFNNGDYTWEDVHNVAKIISGTPSINRDSSTTGAITYGTDRVVLNVGDVFDLVGKIGETGSQTDYTYKVRIIGFNSDKLSSDQYSDGNYVADSTKAGITFEFTNFFKWNGTSENRATNGTYNEVTDTETDYSKGWGASGIRNALNSSDTLNLLANSSYIKQVKKLYLSAYNSSNTSVSNDKLWLLASSEVYPYNGNESPKYGGTYDAESEIDAYNNGQYKWYKTNVTGITSDKTSVLIKHGSSYATNGTYGDRGAGSWWLRSHQVGWKTLTCAIENDGTPIQDSSGAQSVSPGFCI